MKYGMKQNDYIKVGKWFAWRPVRTKNSGWVWLRWVTRVVDQRPEHYLGLLPEYTYFYIKRKMKT